MKYVNWIEKQFGKSVHNSVLFQNMLVKNRTLTVLNNGKLKKRNALIMGAGFPLFFPFAGLPNAFVCLVTQPVTKMITCRNLQDSTWHLKTVLLLSPELQIPLRQSKYHQFCFSVVLSYCTFEPIWLHGRGHPSNSMDPQSMQDLLASMHDLVFLLQTGFGHASITSLFATAGTWKWRNLYTSPSALNYFSLRAPFAHGTAILLWGSAEPAGFCVYIILCEERAWNLARC